MINKIVSSIRNACRGLLHAYRVDKSFRMEIAGSVIFLIIAGLLWPLSGIEIALLTLSYGLILITELINTSVEQLLERLHPERHEIIGRSKDVAAAAVLVAFIIAGVIVITLLLNQYSVLEF